MAGEVDIVNRALSKIGDAMITGLDEPSESAGLAKSLYGTVRDAEISAHCWSFAITRKKLSPEAEVPAFGWAHQYLLPAECLRVLQAGPWPAPVGGGLIVGDTRPFTIESGRILTNRGPVLPVIYLQRVVDVAAFPAAFIEALACKLAVEMCGRKTGSNSNREMAWREYEIAVRQARRINAIGLPPIAIQDDDWMVAHQMGVM